MSSNRHATLQQQATADLTKYGCARVRLQLYDVATPEMLKYLNRYKHKKRNDQYCYFHLDAHTDDLLSPLKCSPIQEILVESVALIYALA